MIALKILFWLSLFIVFYAYIGYGILVWTLLKIRDLFIRAKKPTTSHLPTVTLLIAAYNEEDFIVHKINNTQEIDYPSEKLRVIFITDGSTDSTPDMVRLYSDYEVMHIDKRQGKGMAMNRGANACNSDILVFSDANTLLNRDCIREMVKHYANPKVGGVAGEKRILSNSDDTASAVGEGIYWKYESFLKKMDSRLYSIVGAAGELFSIRRSLYVPVKAGTIIEDFVLSLQVCAQGYVFRYEPEAYAIETASVSMREEQKRKIRICAGGFQAMKMLSGLLNFTRHSILSFQYISHRVLRWAICPVCLLVAFVSNLLLVIYQAGPVYTVFLSLQGIFYLLAFAGGLYASRNIKVKMLYIPYYFVFMNMAAFIGFKRFLKGKQSVIWEKAGRRKFA